MTPTGRRRFLLYSAALAAVTGNVPTAWAQRKAVRIGHLSGSGAEANKALLAAFRDGMRALGYVEGQNLTIEERHAEGKLDRLPQLARELVARKPDVLFVATTPGNLAAKAVTSNIPIVFALVADPVGAGIVPRLARQGGNVTGVSAYVAELGGKRLELLKEIYPKATQFGVMVNPNDQNTPLQMRYAEEGARQLGVALAPIVEVRAPGDLEKGFDALARSRAPAALRMADPLVFMLRRQTTELTLRHRLPLMFSFPEDVEAGGLIGYGANTPAQFRQAAGLVEKILKGANPGDIPVELPSKIDLTINVNTAKALGLTIPAAVLFRADRLIQ